MNQVFSAQEKLELVDRAAGLYERLTATTTPEPEAGDITLINRRLERWCQVVANGDWQKFEQRLAWDGLDLQSIRPYLQSNNYRMDRYAQSSSADLPAWVTVLDEAVAFALQCYRQPEPPEYRFLQAAEPVPFEQIYAPIVEWARRRLLQSVQDSYGLLSDAGQIAFERQLLELLAYHCSRALQLEFSLERANQESPLFRLITQVTPYGDNDFYLQFIHKLLSGGLITFFKEYSVLARQVGTIVGLWIETVAEFVTRLADDLPEITAVFNHCLPPGKVTAVKLGLSDRHKGGRSVAILTFASGLKLVYKPKNVDLETIFFDLLGWFNRHGQQFEQPLLPLKRLAVLNRGRYGWVEFAEYLPCHTLAEAGRFFQRMGMLACIVYALEGNDCHYENIIANGEYPLLVDMETLLHPSTLIDEDKKSSLPAPSLAGHLFHNSVLRTGFLPRWIIRSQAKSYDISGLSGFQLQETSYETSEWRKINTDAMHLVYMQKNIVAQSNIPYLDGRLLNPDEFMADFVQGFRSMYRFFIANRDMLLSDGCPFTRFAGRQARFLVRPTQVYALLLKKAIHPDYLRNGIDRSIEWDALSRGLMQFGTKPDLWPVLKPEIMAMEGTDIPFFTVSTTGTALQFPSGDTLPGIFEIASYDRAVALIKSFDEQDLERQVSFIMASFHARITTLSQQPKRLQQATGPASDSIEPLSQAELLRHAVAIGTELRARAIVAADGSATWIALEPDIRIDHYQLKPLGSSLYSGTTGIALFLAALEIYHPDGGFRDLAIGAIQSFRQDLHNDPQSATRRLTVGGLSGLGSIVYGYLRLSQFLSDTALLDDARLAASLITPARIAGDDSFDITAGSAGAILALLALHESTRDAGLLEQAITCGNHLLANRIASDAGFRAWPTVNGRLITGFSHGAAGIAYALLRLYAATDRQEFLAAANEAIQYERSVFVPEAGNWPDFREINDTPGKTVCLTNWCHGAPGIGMARIAGLPVLDTPEVRQEIAIALATTRQYGMQGLDHLCCGSAGRADFLLQAGRILAQPELIVEAGRRIAWIVDRATHTGAYTLFWNLPTGVYYPGLFQGTAGIGYELLRLSAGGKPLPSILLMQ